ncbi:MAG: VOC family protein [Promethearchaeota archaeon]|jgi:hypothetical protein
MFKHLHHIGVVYKDISKIAEKIKEMYGIEFRIDEVNVPINTAIKELTDPLRIKLAHATIGNTEIELFEPLDDKSIYSEYLKEVPEGGIHHMGVLVENIEEHLKKWDSMGIKRIISGIPPYKFVYYDTREMFGYVTELLELPPPSSTSN